VRSGGTGRLCREQPASLTLFGVGLLSLGFVTTKRRNYQQSNFWD
jgi:hypothetical protein